MNEIKDVPENEGIDYLKVVDETPSEKPDDDWQVNDIYTTPAVLPAIEAAPIAPKTTAIETDGDQVAKIITAILESQERGDSAVETQRAALAAGAEAWSMGSIRKPLPTLPSGCRRVIKMFSYKGNKYKINQNL